MKVKTKSIIALMIALFAVLIIGATQVNAVDSFSVEDALKDIPKENGIYIIKDYVELGEEYNVEEYIINGLNKAFNNKNVTVTRGENGGGGGLPAPFQASYKDIEAEYRIYTNDTYYISINCSADLTYKITVPNNKNTEEYAISKIQEYLKEYNEVANDIAGTTGQDVTFEKLEKVSGEKYKVYYKLVNGIKESAEIIIKENNTKPTPPPTEPISKEDTTTGIKLETTTAVVPSNTILSSVTVTEQKILDTVNKAIKDTTSKYKVYDINLLKDGAKIQPNGKVKISIPIPSDYDKSKLEVYRIDDNGGIIKYNVTVNGEYASFETDHFSIYVLADTTQNNTSNNNQGTETNKPTTNNNRELDETPKTGIQDITYIITAVVIISAVGIIATIKRKQSKH